MLSRNYKTGAMKVGTRREGRNMKILKTFSMKLLTRSLN